MEPEPTCHIDRLPNEILHHILSFFAADSSNSFVVLSPSGVSRAVPGIIGVRWVSRRFRTIANELAFWHDIHFDVTELINLHQRKPRLQARHIRKLFHDEHLVGCLSRKRDWRFSNTETFFAIVMSIPELPQTTRRVWFDCFHAGFHLAVDWLATFTSLTELQITFPNDYDSELPFDLGAIVDSCPHLETLELSYLSEYCGSLAQASNLRKLDVDFEDDSTIVLSTLLPLNSAHCFQSLSIRGEDLEFREFDFNNGDFESLVNITNIKFETLGREFCNILIHGNFTLTSLHIVYIAYEPKLEVVLPIFWASSLEFLRDLDFDAEFGFHWPFQPDLNLAGQIWNAVTNLRRLETLKLKLTCCTSWFKQFAQLSHLISIRLYDVYIVFDDYDGTSLKIACILIVDIDKSRWEIRRESSDDKYKEMLREHTVEVQKRFDSVFADSLVPLVTLA